MKRILSVFLASVFTMGAVVGCGSNTVAENAQSTTSDSNTSGGKYDKELTVSVARRGDVSVVEEDLFAAFLKEEFNMVIEMTEINNSDFVTKMNLSHVAAESPDITISQRPEFMLNEWIEAGYLRGYTREEIEEKMPNYVAQYTEEEWDVVWASIKHSDDKAYYFPSRRATSMNMAWMYRKDIFDELGLEFPETTDELIEVLKIIKDETGKYPIVAASAGNVLWAFTGYLQAFGMPELSPRFMSYVDPVTGEFIPHIFTTDSYREHIIFMNRLYEEGLLWPEFATGTDDQVNAMISQGHGHVMWGYPEKVDTDYNRLSQNADPNASWEWAEVMLTSDPEVGYFYKAEPYYNADGVAFSVDADDEVVERFMEFLDWIHTEEGMVLRTYGFEGETYTKEGDNYVFMEHMMSPLDVEGKTVSTYGVLGIGRQHPNLNDYYKPYITDLENTFIGRENYYPHIAPIINFTDEESKELASISSSLDQTAQEYYAKFIMGHMDVTDDKEWDNYISVMERLGLERFKEIRTTAYERTNQ